MVAIAIKVYRYSPEQVTASTLKAVDTGISIPAATSVSTRLAADLAADSVASDNIRHITCTSLGGEIVYTILHW